MFCYKFPKFQKDHILRTEMLEMLRDYPKNFTELYFNGYSNGIVTGCELSWEMDQLSIGSGIIYNKGKFYFLQNNISIACKPYNHLQYLKAEFLTEEFTQSHILGNARVCLDEAETNPLKEQELCRFHFQDGARLRCIYESFEDFSTEFDTINQTHVSYCTKGGVTLKPEILMRFAEEMLEEELDNAYDISFSMQILANSGMISQECIKRYLKIRLESYKLGEEVGELYKGLLAVRKGLSGNGIRRKEPMGNRRIILM